MNTILLDAGGVLVWPNWHRVADALRARGVAAEELPDVPSAVARAFERAVEGQAILFSPACASFDAYLNFEQRARHFRSCLPPVDAPQPHAVER